MKRILKETVNMKHYTAHACVVWCFDNRFSPLLAKLIQERRMEHTDLVKIAGGAKSLTGENGDSKNFIISQIAASLRLHRTPLVILMTHSDCGAYNLKFQNPSEEIKFYANELNRARETVAKNFPDLRVETLFADASGIVEV